MLANDVIYALKDDQALGAHEVADDIRDAFAECTAHVHSPGYTYVEVHVTFPAHAQQIEIVRVNPQVGEHSAQICFGENIPDNQYHVAD